MLSVQLPKTTVTMSMANPNKKVLIILSDANSFPLHTSEGTTQQPSGFFLMELAKPLQKILDAGYQVTFASPLGKEPQPDPNSESLLAFAGNYYEQKREHALVERMKRDGDGNSLARPRRFADVGDDELDSFDGVLIPGGHAPLADLGDDAELGRILRHFHRRLKPTAAICHGPYALLSTRRAGDGEFAYKGYRITSWSDAEESVMETALRGEIDKVEGSLREAGADMQNGMGEKVGAVTVDRELVSGGNPLAAATLGDKFLELLGGYCTI